MSYFLYAEIVTRELLVGIVSPTITTDSFIVGLTIPCSLSITHAFDFTWNMPAKSGTFS